MAKYIKKPIIVDAEPYRKGLEDAFEWRHWHDLGNKEGRFITYKWFAAAFLWVLGVRPGTYMPVPYIATKEGRMDISPGDWIITGIQGERYPCKPDIFEATYELVETGNGE